MIENKPAIALDNFKGLFDQGYSDDVPFDHFVSALNCVPSSFGIATREGSVLSLTLPSILRFHPYKRIGEAQRLIILTTGGNFYDSLDLVTPILTVATATDFSMVSMFNRAYITPHNGAKGISGEFVYVYEGSGVCRKAAGVAPTGFTLGVTDSALSGYIETGTHLFAVAYETSTGFITIPGPAIYAEYEAPGGFKATVSAIPLGPAGTAARHLVGTKILVDYNGDQVNQAYYFIPGGSIEDNTTETLDIDFFDADLQASADYLFDQLAEIPASLGLGDYQGSLVTYGEYSYDSIIRVSKVANPESFATTDGYLPIDPGDGEGIKNCVEYRGNLVIFKSKRTYVTVSNGDAVAFWKADSVDKSVGTEIFGVGQILDARGASTDTLVIADRSGLLLYDGTYRMNLTDKISNIWTDINQAEFHQVEVYLDPTSQRVYVNFPYLTSSTPNYILMGDYQRGLDKDNIKWFKWSFPQNPKCIGIDIDNSTQAPIFKYGGTNIYALDKTVYNDVNTAINCYVQSAYLHFIGKGITFRDFINNFSDIKVRATGVGSLIVTLYGLDNVSTVTLPVKALAASPGKPLQWHCNFTVERMSVKFSMNTAGSYFNLARFAVFGNKLWFERPM